MDVAVIGTGYVGLVTGAVFADLGNNVICVDVDEKKIAMLNSGKSPIYEPGLDEIIARTVADGRLSFTSDTDGAVKRSLVVFIAVGTPPAETGETDLSQVESAALAIARALDRYKVIVNKSTVPVGTGNFVHRIIETNKRRRVDFDVVSNPEFLREGSAIQDMLNPDRIVIGAPSQSVAMTLLELYSPLEAPMLVTDVESAELIKYASNAFLATKISFINAIADLCEETGADIRQVAKGMGFDRRIGREFLQAGLGYGGSCFPKDTLSLAHTASRYGVKNELLESVIRINSLRIPRLISRIEKKLGGLENKTIGLLGLAFKPNTDDIRDAKSIEVIRLLLDAGAKIRAYDPVATDNARKALDDGRVEYCDNAYAAATGADALLVVTEWNEFRFLDFERVRSLMRSPIVFDGRNIYPPERMQRAGIDYCPIGGGSRKED